MADGILFLLRENKCSGKVTKICYSSSSVSFDSTGSTRGLEKSYLKNAGANNRHISLCHKDHLSETNRGVVVSIIASCFSDC